MRLLSILVAVCVLFSGLTDFDEAHAEKPPSGDAERTYRDQSRGFSISLPRSRGWRFFEPSSEDVAVTLENSHVTVDVICQVVDQDLQVDFIGILGRDFARERSEHYREIEAKLVNREGVDFYELEYVSSQEGKSLHTLRRIYVHRLKIISITVVALEKAWAKNRLSITEVLNSFSFED